MALNTVDDTESLESTDVTMDAEAAEGETLESSRYLQLARQVSANAVDYLDSSQRKQWETNLRNFHSRIDGKNAGKGRKFFRPKIRSAVRAYEAALASALFTNNDLLSVKGADPNNRVQALSAKINQAMLQYRLETTIPWFQTVIGAFQDTHVYGVCVSKTYWETEVERETELMPLMNEAGDDYEYDEEGNVLGEEVVVNTKIIKDEPVLDMMPPDHLLFDPNADWRDPVHTSGYLVELIPMSVADVMAKGTVVDPKTGHPDWFEYSKAQILAAGAEQNNETTRQAIQDGGQDPHEANTGTEFDIVWVHFNIIREGNKDIAFYTLGTSLLLSEPAPLTDYFKLGRDTYQIGVSTIESHRPYPAASAELGGNIQDEINTVANQRIENVKLVLNKRYFIRRQGNVDLQALMRNVAGGGVMVDDPQNDVLIVNTPDITSSSYAEQDRLNMDMDDILGTFSPSTVQANRALNETVGGMNLMSNGANAVQELSMRTFIETWVEKVLSSLVKLEQLYETDNVILGLGLDAAGVRQQLLEQAGDQDMLEQLIKQDLLIRVNVGMGNTNPEQKLNRLMMAVNTTAQFPEIGQKTDFDEVVKEIYSYAGFGDGQRFLMTPEKLQQKQQEQQGQTAPEVQIEQMKGQIQQALQQMRSETDLSVAQLRQQTELELGYARLALEEGKTVAQIMAQLDIHKADNATKRDVEASRSQDHNREMDVRVNTGAGV